MFHKPSLLKEKVLDALESTSKESRVDSAFVSLRHYVDGNVKLCKNMVLTSEVVSIMDRFNDVVNRIKHNASEMEVNEARNELIHSFINLDKVVRYNSADGPEYYKLKFELHNAFNEQIELAYVERTSSSIDNVDVMDIIKSLEERVKVLEEKLNNLEK